MKKLSGIVTPMVTPFDRRGEIDSAALRELTEFLIRQGVHALYPLGTTGEAVFMTVEERMKAAQVVVAQTSGRVPVFVQVGSVPTENAVKLARHAWEIGADGIAVLTPFYFRYSDQELLAYYEAIVASVPDGFPVYLYNIPVATGNDLKPGLVAKLASRFPNVVGIKNSMADIDRLRSYRQISKSFSVLVGCDSLISAAYLEGCDGAVSGPSQVVPGPYVGLIAALESGNLMAAAKLQRVISEMCEALRFGHVPTIKAAMRALGLPGGFVRPPFIDLDAREEAELRRCLASITEEVGEWLEGRLGRPPAPQKV